MSATLIESSREQSVRVVLLSKRYMPLDEQVMRTIERHLAGRGFQVFCDQHLPVGVEWAKNIATHLKDADAVIPIISAGAAQSELLAYEIEIAHEAAQRGTGRPMLLPVRVKPSGPLPDLLSRVFDAGDYHNWMGPDDDQRLTGDLIKAIEPLSKMGGEKSVAGPLAGSAQAQPRKLASMPGKLEPVYGAVPLESEFYLTRPQDAELRTAVLNRDSIVLIKGARQMGKTSLLARGLQQGRERGAKVVLTDFQKLNISDLESAASLYKALGESISDQLDLPVLPKDVWDEQRGANVNFERFIRREVLAKLNAPLVWGLDEVDRLFTCDFGSEVFGLFRSWHNERALDPNGPWAGLTMAIAYATEAHLFITDMNQSPFNVGVRLVLEDFTAQQVSELNRRYRSPLVNESEIERFIRLLGGHPFLVRRALHELTTQPLNITGLEAQADRDEGIFGDHLRRMLVLLARDPALTDVVRGILKGGPCATPDSFYRLRSAGLVSGASPTDVRPRCRLYATYLKRHLL